MPVERKALEGAELGRQRISLSGGGGVYLEGKKTVTIYCIEKENCPYKGENALRLQRIQGTRHLVMIDRMGSGSHWSVRERRGEGRCGGGKASGRGSVWAGVNGTGGEGDTERGHQSRL